MNYLYDSVQDFLASPMWTGDKAYAQTPIRPWFGWLYIAEFNSFSLDTYLTPQSPEDVLGLRLKFGMSLNIAQRTAALEQTYRNANAEQNSATILYAWSVPRPFTFETKIKQFLKAFIHKDALAADMSGRTEIVHGLEIMPLLRVMQFCILQQCLALRYINGNNDILRQRLTVLMRTPPDVIRTGRTYNGRRQSRNVRKIFDVRQALRLVRQAPLFPAAFDEQKEDEPEALFLQYVFDAEDIDARVENPALQDRTNDITDDQVATDPAESDIPTPFRPDDCVFAKYKRDYSPARILGYGTGGYKGEYVIEWLASQGTNSKMRFEKDGTGRYKPWRNIAGDVVRHEFKAPGDIKSWNVMFPGKTPPDPARWPTRATRRTNPGGESKNNGMTPQDAKRVLQVGTRVKKVTDSGSIRRGTVETVTKAPDQKTNTGKFGIRGGSRVQNPVDWEVES